MEHIDAMDQLKQGIGLRSMARWTRVRLHERRFELFDAMVAVFASRPCAACT
jgi:preprotein translocase subunit SecA